MYCTFCVSLDITGAEQLVRSSLCTRDESNLCENFEIHHHPGIGMPEDVAMGHG